MATKKFFTGPEMEDLSGPLTEAQTKLAVTSFKLAARVANAAWAYLRASAAKDFLAADTRKAELEQALHGYSPENWPIGPSESNCEYARERLQVLYNDVYDLPDKEAILLKIYEFVSKEYES